MKLLYTLLFTIALTGTYTAAAQTETKPVKEEKLTGGPEYDKHYEKLKELYIKQLRSGTHKKQRQLNNAFIAKMNFKGDPKEIQKDILGWVKNNIDKTNFESYEAAEQEWQAIITAGMDDFQENQEYYEYMRICFQCCDGLFLQVLTDVGEEYPELVYGE